MPNLRTVKEKVAAADAAQGTGGLMTKKVDAAVQGMLAHKVNPNDVWRVILCIDASGSMSDEYAAGHVQSAVDGALGFAVIVDDDGDVPVVVFDSDVWETEVKLNDFSGFIKREGITSGTSTNLTGALQAIARITGDVDVLRGGEPQVRKAASPALAVVVTDGRPDKEDTARDVIRRLSYRAVFFKFIFVGHDRRGWEFLQGLDEDIPVGASFDRGGRYVDNVSAVRLSSLGDGDKAFYDAMFQEMGGYPALARSKGLL